MSNSSNFSRRRFLLMSGLTAVGVGATANLKGNAASASSRFQQVLDIGKQAYIWGFPLVLIQRELSQAISKQTPLNQIFKSERLATPEDQAVGPNNDTLYASAWLDLRREPLILHVPDTGGRYYSIQLQDAYSNTFAYVGRRVTGTQEGNYAIVGPTWEGNLPDGVKEIKSLTNTALLLGRTLVYGDADLPNAQAIQQQYTLTPLSTYPNVEPPSAAQVDPLSLFPPFDLASTGIEFYDELGVDIQNDPPPADQRYLLREFERVGIGPNRHPSQLKNATVVAALKEAVIEGEQLIKNANYSTNVNGWSVNYRVTNYITDFLLRASVVQFGPLTNVAEEALYFGATVDAAGKPLVGANKYLVHFDAGGLPPVDAFWSLTLYDSDFHLVANSINRYEISDRTAGLQYGADGSLDIYIQSEAPTDFQSNWLPAPPDGFRIILRTYQPRPEVLNGTYQPPPVTQVN